MNSSYFQIESGLADGSLCIHMDISSGIDRPIENDNRMYRSLEGVLIYIYIKYTNELTYFLYGEERKLKNPQILAKRQLLLTKEKNSW